MTLYPYLLTYFHQTKTARAKALAAFSRFYSRLSVKSNPGCLALGARDAHGLLLLASHHGNSDHQQHQHCESSHPSLLCCGCFSYAAFLFSWLIPFTTMKIEKATITKSITVLMNIP